MNTKTMNLSTPQFELVLDAGTGPLRLTRLAAGGTSWLDIAGESGLFGVTVDGRHYDAANLEFVGSQEDLSTDGIRHVTLSFQGPGLTIQQHILIYADSAVIEFYPVITNQGQQPIRVEHVDSLALHLRADEADLMYYTGSWGSEFEPHHSRLDEVVVLQSRSGRSSKGNHPWFALTAANGQVLSGAVAWSGNWIFRFEPVEAGGLRLSGGLNDWQFFKDLAPGASLTGAPVVLAMGSSLNAVSQEYTRVGRRHWYPVNDLSSIQPVEWNHWWPYEDAEINEDVFVKNVEVAEPMGFEVCTLDAGWFGPADAGTFWEHYRGDWDLVNNDRFPQGIRHLADQVHARNMKFGIWCEIEGLGEHAQVAKDHPDYVALRDGEWLGGVCFANPQVQEWAYQTLSRLINEYGADWIKVDFNLDLGAGCNRTDHGHQEGDGLYEHIQGYYRVMERVRQSHPQVVLENCSSGGLRIDLGIARRTFMAFLSDPDWPVHDLQIFWGASTMLAPNVLLHWPFSYWRNLNPPPYQNFDPHDPNLTSQKWDYYSRISMLGLYGHSQRLPDLPAWLAKRMKENIAVYRQHVRRFVREADLYRLTDQPRRSGEGERWVAFQYSLPDKSEHVLFVFRMPGASPQRAIVLQDLQPDRLYSIQGFEGEARPAMLGRALMTSGLLFDALGEETSALLKLS